MAALGTQSSALVEAEVDSQVAAPAETRTPNWHRAKKSLNKECGWKDGDRGGLAQESKTHLGKNKTVLTRTGLLMEGVGFFIYR